MTGLQWRTEAAGSVLGLAGIFAPYVDRLLREQAPGRGRSKSATSAATTSVLAFSPQLPQDVKQVSIIFSLCQGLLCLAFCTSWIAHK